MNLFPRMILSLILIIGFMGLSIPVQAKDKKDDWVQQMLPLYRLDPVGVGHYKDLGPVSAKFKGDTFLTDKKEIYRKLAHELTLKAKHIGANAVIRTSFVRLDGSTIFVLQGEAVFIKK